MGNRSSLLLREEEIAQIQTETGCKFFIVVRSCTLYFINKINFHTYKWFLILYSSHNSKLKCDYFLVTPNQIERLYSRFTSLDRGDCGTLSRDDFLRIPELAINPLGERIVNSFFQSDDFNDRVNFRQFMQVLAHFIPIKKNKENRLNTREEKLRC